MKISNSVSAIPSIRHTVEEDWPQILGFARKVIASGESYAWCNDLSDEILKGMWLLNTPAEVFSATLKNSEAASEDIIGSGVLKPNQLGRGNHVANFYIMVDPAFKGRKIGTRLANFMIDRAVEIGYSAIQLNAVVATNRRAVRLWTGLGFDVIGTVPAGFRHPVHGLTDLLIMHRFL
ncbi:GNAT family N-acetyltransferase [Streptomyces sp. NPDC086783]|uniref:GNAT family N-acetyltransferase n=1 Tax=Streptomyces sp. NPDC086783 TaxID=3365758 RepID=UPI0037FAEFC2